MYSSLLLNSGWSHRLKCIGGKCHFPKCGNSMCDLCQKCGMGIAAEEAGKLPRLHIQQNTQAISRVTCLCSNIFLLKLIAVPCVYGGGEEYGLFCWASARAHQRKWAFLFLSLFLERATLDLYPFCKSTSFYSLGLKSTVVSSFVWSQLCCRSQNLQKLIVNVFTNKKKFHRIKCYNCASEIKL